MQQIADEPVNASHRPPHLLANFREYCWLFIVGLTAMLLCLPFMFTVFSLSDEGVLLHGAQRLIRGQKLYLDFFEFLPPGGFVILAAWFAMVGTSIWSARVLVVLTITMMACFTFLASREASKNAPLSALTTIAWVVVSQGFWTQINHHWFTTLFSIVAAWAALSSIARPRQWLSGPLIAGLAAGAAAMVTPTRGVLAILAAGATFVDLRCQVSKLLAFLFGAAVVPVCLLAYVIGQGAFFAAFDDVILFTGTRYASIQSVPFGSSVDAQTRPLLFLFPLISLLVVIVCTRNWRRILYDRMFRSSVYFCLAGFIGCFPRPDMAHISFAAPLAFPLVTYLVDRISASWRRKYRYAVAALAFVISIPSVLQYCWVANLGLRGEIVMTKEGYFLNHVNGTRNLMSKIADTPPADSYLFYPYLPLLAFLTGREHISKVDVFVPNYTLPSQYEEACLSALQRATWVVIDRAWANHNLLRLYFPMMRDVAPPEVRKFEQALESGYELVAHDGEFELRRRIDSVDESVCAGIAD